jgi:hypothetical protein
MRKMGCRPSQAGTHSLTPLPTANKALIPTPAFDRVIRCPWIILPVFYSNQTFEAMENFALNTA